MENRLVPLPGTFEYHEWENSLRDSGRSKAVSALQHWNQTFSASDPRLKSALRRIRIIQGHLLVPRIIPKTYVVE
eukprot:snap_masked-scaffold_56-processed-gene-0.36-mRNA-1 protein AED:1.00 eAED:1.00 QI:0/-1/0/0/-1/1/1/0/74